MNAHLGAIRLGRKATWADQDGEHLGRVVEIVYTGSQVWARVAYLPLTSTPRSAWIALQDLRCA